MLYRILPQLALLVVIFGSLMNNRALLRLVHQQHEQVHTLLNTCDELLKLNNELLDTNAKLREGCPMPRKIAIRLPAPPPRKQPQHATTLSHIRRPMLRATVADPEQVPVTRKPIGQTRSGGD